MSKRRCVGVGIAGWPRCGNRARAACAGRVSCPLQTDDDLPWILKYAGEHSLVIGTDYGHTDPSSELDAISVFRQMAGMSQETKDRILSHNQKVLYNL